MKQFTLKDFVFATLTGFITGTISWLVLEYLGHPAPLGIPWAWLMVVIPILWIAGVNFGYFLGQWITFFNQFGKFVAIGFTNFAVDVGIFNFLFAAAHLRPEWFIACKSASFVIAAFHSYGWNKYWAFGAGASRGGKSELSKFIAVSLLALLVNVIVARSVALAVPAGMDVKTWTNVGLVVGAAAALAFSFIGFRMVVFNRR